MTREAPGIAIPVLLRCDTELRVSFESSLPGCYEDMFFSVEKIKFS